MSIFFKRTIPLLASILLLFILSAPGTFFEAFAQSSNQSSTNTLLKLKVTASVRPLHSIAAAIMKGVGTPTLLLENSQSSHHASLRLSQAKTLYNSDVIFWIGSGLEAFLTKPLSMLDDNSTVIALGEESTLEYLQLQNDLTDPHIWLSIENAIIIARIIKNTLATSDPANAGTYEENFLLLENEIRALRDRLAQILANTKNKNYLIYHDALGYLGKQFEFRTRPIAVGNEELTPSAKQIASIGRLARSGDYQCILVEPNINASSVRTAASEAGLPIAVLDPNGTTMAPGAGLYSTMMLDLARIIANCAK